jgi:Secretion system C-terminal sorting domain/Galactose oxidase, central domain/Kelch motif
MKNLIIFPTLILFIGSAFGQWTETYLSEYKDYMAVAVSGKKVFFAGGYAVDETFTYQFATDKVEICDTETGTWVYDQLSEGRYWMEGVSAGSKVIFAGGFTAAENISATVDIYDVISNDWAVAQLSIPRILLSPLSVGNKVLFAGGNGNDLKTQTRVDIYDTSTEQWSTAELSEPRMGTGAASIGDLAFFAGGLVWDNSAGIEYASNRIDIYNAATNTWSTDSLSEPRFFLAAAAVRDKILFAGGLTISGGPSKRVDIYDVATGTWSIDSLSVARAFEDNDQNAVTIGGKAYFVGGMYRIMSDYQADFNVIDIYDPVSNTWETDELPYNLFAHSVVGVAGKLIVAGGASLHPLGLDIHNQVLIKQLVSSIEFVGVESRFDLSPNPTADAFFINLPTDVSPLDVHMQVYDLQGRLLLQKHGNGIQDRHDVSDWNAGVYVIRLLGKGINATSKLLKLD